MSPTASSPDNPSLLAQLQAELAQAQAQVATLTADFEGLVAASASSNSDDEHDPEGATIAFERAQVVAVLQHLERRIIEIESARSRLHNGTYGRCSRCGNPIAPERLEARPSADTCLGCARTAVR